MKNLVRAVVATALCCSLAQAAENSNTEKQRPERRETAREIMLKDRTPEQKKLARCGVKAGNEELAGKEREKFIEKCMAK